MTKEFRCRNHNGVTGIICDMVGSCPLGGASSDQNKHSFSYVGKGTVPRSPLKDVYKAPTERQRAIAENSAKPVKDEDNSL
jgi:hypothetical protein